jgi:transcriptional regulator with XRE-family HTH domain
VFAVESPPAEVQRALRLLSALIAAHGYSRKDVDARLGRGAGYVSQILTGRLELKYKHVLEILAALELDPASFFGALYAAPDRGETE